MVQQDTKANWLGEPIQESEYSRFGIVPGDLERMVKAAGGPVVFLDYETTGTNEKKEGITEVAALKIVEQNGRYEIQRFHHHLLPLKPSIQLDDRAKPYDRDLHEYRISDEALKVTGTAFDRDDTGRIVQMRVKHKDPKTGMIEMKPVAEAKLWHDVAPALVDFLEDAKIVTAYNAPFDMRWTNQKIAELDAYHEAQNHGEPPLAPRLPACVHDPRQWVCQFYGLIAHQGESARMKQDDAMQMVRGARDVSFDGRDHHEAYEDTLMLMAITAVQTEAMGGFYSMEHLFRYVLEQELGGESVFQVSRNPENGRLRISYPARQPISPHVQELWESLEQLLFVSVRNNRAKKLVHRAGLCENGERFMELNTDEELTSRLLVRFKLFDELVKHPLIERVRVKHKTGQVDMVLKGQGDEHARTVMDVPVSTLRKCWAAVKENTNHATELKDHLALIKDLTFEGKVGIVTMATDPESGKKVITVKSHQNAFGDVRVSLPKGSSLSRHRQEIIRTVHQLYQIGAIPDVGVAEVEADEQEDTKNEHPEWVHVELEIGKDSSPMRLSVSTDLAKSIARLADIDRLSATPGEDGKQVVFAGRFEKIKAVSHIMRQVSWMKYRLEKLPGVTDFTFYNDQAILRFEEGISLEAMQHLNESGLPFTALSDRIIVPFEALVATSYHASRSLKDAGDRYKDLNDEDKRRVILRSPFRGVIPRGEDIETLHDGTGQRIGLRVPFSKTEQEDQGTHAEKSKKRSPKQTTDQAAKRQKNFDEAINTFSLLLGLDADLLRTDGYGELGIECSEEALEIKFGPLITSERDLALRIMAGRMENPNAIAFPDLVQHQQWLRGASEAGAHLTYDGNGNVFAPARQRKQMAEVLKEGVKSLHYLPGELAELSSLPFSHVQEAGEASVGARTDYATILRRVEHSLRLEALQEGLHRLILALPNEHDFYDYRTAERANQHSRAESIIAQIASAQQEFDVFMREEFGVTLALMTEEQTMMPQLMQGVEQDKTLSWALYHLLAKNNAKKYPQASNVAQELALRLGALHDQLDSLKIRLQEAQDSYAATRGNSMLKSMGEWLLHHQDEISDELKEILEQAEREQAAGDLPTLAATWLDKSGAKSEEISTRIKAWHDLAALLAGPVRRQFANEPATIEWLQREAEGAWTALEKTKGISGESDIGNALKLFLEASGNTLVKQRGTVKWDDLREKYHDRFINLLTYVTHEQAHDVSADLREEAERQLVNQAAKWREALTRLEYGVKFTREELHHAERYFDRGVEVKVGRKMRQVSPFALLQYAANTIDANTIDVNAPPPFLADAISERQPTRAEQWGKGVKRTIKSLQNVWGSAVSAISRLVSEQYEQLSQAQATRFGSLITRASDAELAEMTSRDLATAMGADVQHALASDPMQALASRLADFIESNETTIGLIGDYDVDGATSSALMHRYLGMLGKQVLTDIPDRFEDGYGASHRAINRFSKAGLRHVMTLDNGTVDPPRSDKERQIDKQSVLRRAREEKGMNILVIDHHKTTPEGATPAQVATVVNPNIVSEGQEPDVNPLHPFRKLSAAGVAFMVALATTDELRARAEKRGNSFTEPNLTSLLDLVAIGHVADVMPVVDLGGELTEAGLDMMQRGSNIGVSEIMRALHIRRRPTVEDIGFGIGPWVNSCGRLERLKSTDPNEQRDRTKDDRNSSMGYQLFSLGNSADDQLRAKEITTIMREANDERKALQLTLMREALPQAIEQVKNDAVVVVAHGKNWHKGVTGIAASQLKEQFGRPAVVFSVDEKEAKGSARSIPGYDISAGLIEIAHEVGGHGGGHQMAAGLTIPKAELKDFTDRINQDALEAHVDELMQDQRWFGVSPEHKFARAAEMTPAAVRRIERMPAAQTRPNWVVQDMKIESIDQVGPLTNHLKIVALDGDDKPQSFIAFNRANTPLHALLEEAKATNEKVQLYVQPKLNAKGEIEPFVRDAYVGDVSDKVPESVNPVTQVAARSVVLERIDRAVKLAA